MFVGRKTELKLLNDAYRSEKDEHALPAGSHHDHIAVGLFGLPKDPIRRLTDFYNNIIHDKRTC